MSLTSARTKACIQSTMHHSPTTIHLPPRVNHQSSTVSQPPTDHSLTIGTADGAPGPNGAPEINTQDASADPLPTPKTTARIRRSWPLRGLPHVPRLWLLKVVGDGWLRGCWRWLVTAVLGLFAVVGYGSWLLLAIVVSYDCTYSYCWL